MFSGKTVSAGFSGGALFFTATCVGFIVFGRWMVNAHSGEVELTDTGIVQRKGGEERQLAYNDIHGVSHRRITFPELVLRGRGGEMVINKNLAEYPAFWCALAEKAPQLESQIGEQQQIIVNGKAGESYFAFGIFLVISVVFLVGAWVGYYIGEVGLALCLGVSAPSGLFAAILGYCIAVTERGWRFSADTVVIMQLTGNKTYSRTQITAARYGQKRVNASSRFGSKLAHFIEFEFAGNNRVYIDNFSTDYPVEQLVRELTKLWQLEKMLEVVSSQ